MTTITIRLPDDSAAKLQETADRLGVPPEELARVSVEELLRQPEQTLQHAVDHVLDKNAELYRRLS